MPLSGFTHYRLLNNGPLGSENCVSLEWRPEIDILLTFLNANQACISLDGIKIPENLDKGERWLNTRIAAFNRHVVVVYSEMEEHEFVQQQAAFTVDRPPPPFGFTFEEYVSAVISRKNTLINHLMEIDESFNSNDIASYINSFAFSYVGYQSIQSWMLEILSGNNSSLYPSYLVSNNLWDISKMKEVYDMWITESVYSDINKIFNAFELYTLNCILEVI